MKRIGAKNLRGAYEREAWDKSRRQMNVIDISDRDRTKSVYRLDAWCVKGDYDINTRSIFRVCPFYGECPVVTWWYWEAKNRQTSSSGGAIWDWVDQSMINYDKNDRKTLIGVGGNSAILRRRSVW